MSVICKLSDGFEVEVNEAFLNDMEVVDKLAELAESDNDFASIRILSYVSEKLFGKDGKKKIYDHIRDEKGVVKVDVFENAMAELMNSVSETKNSSSSLRS